MEFLARNIVKSPELRWGVWVHRNYLNSGIITSGENEPIILCLFIKFAYYESIGWNEMSQEAGMQMGRGPAWPRECPQVAPISSQGRAKTNSSEVPSPQPPCPLLHEVLFGGLEKGILSAGIHPGANLLKAKERKKSAITEFLSFFNFPGSQAARDF